MILVSVWTHNLVNRRCVSVHARGERIRKNPHAVCEYGPVGARCIAKENPPVTMSLNRRSFIAGSAAIASQPALGAVSASGETDVAIIGAGAAGIAAARKVAAAGRRYLLLEASDRIGGRCVTDTATFGVPYDRGAHWLHTPDINPIAKLAARASGM